MKTKLIKNNESKLYNRGSKKYIADLLSDKDKNIIFTKNDWRKRQIESLNRYSFTCEYSSYNTNNDTF